MHRLALRFYSYPEEYCEKQEPELPPREKSPQPESSEKEGGRKGGGGGGGGVFEHVLLHHAG